MRRRRLTRWRRTLEAHVAARGGARLLYGRALVHAGHFARAGVARDGLNINGPSVIRVPEWAPRRAHPAARYYLYFAHHLGAYLRMAWAERLHGPWTLFNVGPERPDGARGRGVFDLATLAEPDLTMQDGLRIGSEKPWGLHVASPDVHVDDPGRRVVLYAHMPVLGGAQSQMTFALTSRDGLSFEGAGRSTPFVGLGPSYFRVFEVEGQRYAISPGGWLHRAPGPGWGLAAQWTRGLRVFEVPKNVPRFEDGRVREGAIARHLAVDASGERVTLLYTQVGAEPERVLAADLLTAGADWRAWRAGPPRELHRPRAAWEGARFAVRPSSGGLASGGVNELRDPYVFVDADGRRTLFYCVQGEHAIAARTIGSP